jgi:dihydrofolate reductase
MGRKTYEDALRRGGMGGGYPGVKTYVFSRTLKQSTDASVTIVSEDAAEFVRKLKQRDGKDICVMGGGELARSLFEAELIDEIGFNIHPVLLGSGIPVYHPMSRQTDLQLIKCRTLKFGCVLVTYRVKHTRPSKDAPSASKKQQQKTSKARKPTVGKRTHSES